MFSLNVKAAAYTEHILEVHTGSMQVQLSLPPTVTEQLCPLEINMCAVISAAMTDVGRKLSTLTHWGLVTPFGDIDLGQHWLR